MLKKTSALLVMFSLLLSHARSQQTPSTFTLQGTINARDSGKLMLLTVNTEDYYPSYHGTKEDLVINGHFSITDSAPYPEAYRIGLKYDSTWAYISNPFYIEPGINTIRCDSNHVWETPAITNPTMDESHNGYHAALTAYIEQSGKYYSLADSLYNAYKGKAPEDQAIRLSTLEKDMRQTYYRTLLAYVKTHPTSYLACWNLVNAFNKGYDPLFDSTYDAFSPMIRNTYTGKMLGQKLSTARLSCIGCRFPDLRFANINDLSRKVPILKVYPKYTLIDVWYSHCSACIEQFPRLKELHAQYQSAGFTVIGISTDYKKEDIALWKKLIAEKELPWSQFLDDHGVMFKDFGLDSWPCNFLLDEKGMVIQKNIEPEALKLFLDDHLAAH